MSATGALRRRRRPSLRTRVRVAWVFVALAMLVAAAAVYALITLPQLRVGHVAVRVDGNAVRPSEVRARAAIDPHANAWLLDTAAIERRVETIPFVDVVRIERRPPAHVLVAVALRTPYACLGDATHALTIDHDRRVLETGCAGGLPHFGIARADYSPGAFVRDEQLARIDRDAQALEAAGIHVRSARLDRFGQLVVTQGGGIVLLLGDDNAFLRKVALVRPVLAAADRHRRIVAVDVRAPDTPIVRFR